MGLIRTLGRTAIALERIARALERIASELDHQNARGRVQYHHSSLFGGRDDCQ